MKEPILTVLLSGAVGALVALIFTIWRENARLRTDLALQVIRWADDVYNRAINLQATKKSLYADMNPYLTEGEYKENSRALNELLTQNSVLAQVQIVYGPGDEVALFREFRHALEQAARVLRQARRETWDASERDLKSLVEQQVDPLRAKFEQRLLRHAGFPVAWLRFWRLIKRALLAMRERVAKWWRACFKSSGSQR